MTASPSANVRRISPQLQNIRVPAPLQDMPFWLCWKLEHHVGEVKPRKVPYYADGGRRVGKQGTAEDVGKLVDFVTARDAAIRRGMDGVGFALLPDHDISMTDFDNCVGPDGEIDPRVFELVKDTYHEFSPSCSGIRAAHYGDLGNRKSRAQPGLFGFETFSTSGFVTITGNACDMVTLVGYEDKIAPVSDALRQYCTERFAQANSKLPDVADDFTAGHEPKLGLSLEEIESLLDQLDPDMGRDEWIRVGLALHHETEGDDTGFDCWNDWSSMGGKYPGEDGLREQWDSFERRQGVKRHNITMATVKWMATQDDLRLTPTAAQIAAKADALVADLPRADRVATPDGFEGKWPILPAEKVTNRPAPGWWVKGVLPKADLGIIFGASGSGKSFVALQMAAALSMGAPWRGFKTIKARVLMVVAEGAGSYGSRVKALCEQLGVEPWELDIGFIFGAPNVLDSDDITAILAAVKAARVDIIVWDTYAQVTPGANENSAEDMGRALANLRIIATETGAMNILIHHAGKDASKGARGWSGNHAAADVVLEVVRYDDGQREVRTAKLKDGKDDQHWGFKLETVVVGVDEDGEAVTTCVVVDAEAPKTATPTNSDKRVKRRGRLETHVLEMISTLGTRDTVPLAELVTVCSDAMPEVPTDKRDTRRQSVTRAIQSLSREKDGPLRIEGNLVVLFE